MSSVDRPQLRIALLGVDATTVPFVRAIVHSHRCVLSGICEFDDAMDASAAELHAILGGRVRRLDSWEALLDSQQVDAVIVARAADQDRRAEQLRKFIQTSVPVLVSHPVVDSMLVYYELDMIRRETGGIVLPMLVARRHPAIESLGDLVRQGDSSPIGKVQQLTVARTISEATKDKVIAEFASDVDLIRAVVGDLTRLGAMAGGDADQTLVGVGVQMSGPSGIAARWSVVPGASDGDARITLVGLRGTATVQAHFQDDEPWTMELVPGQESTTRQYEEWDAASEALDLLARAIDGQLVSPDWVDAARSVELAETIERSLAKSRTIELYYEDYTEEGTFKGTMTSVGCGLLVLAMLVLGAVAIAEQMGVPYTRSWPYVLLAACGVFLLMQFLLFVSRKRQPAETEQGLPSSEVSSPTNR